MARYSAPSQTSLAVLRSVKTLSSAAVAAADPCVASPSSARQATLGSWFLSNLQRSTTCARYGTISSLDAATKRSMVAWLELPRMQSCLITLRRVASFSMGVAGVSLATAAANGFASGPCG